MALVARDGAIDWLCWPTFDAPAIFAALLDARSGGFWRIAPVAHAHVRRTYRADSNVLETRFDTANGTICVTDAMSVDDPHDVHPRNQHELLRLVTCERGVVEIEVEFAPRPDFGRRHARLAAHPTLGIRLQVGARLYALHGERMFDVRGATACARFTLRAGERARFALTYDEDVAAIPLLGEYADARVDAATRWWQAWLARLTYDGPDRELVARSLLATKLLVFAPSGAIVAAPTTSLPERIGGSLNWDYRFCWLRDASLTARAFHDLGFRDDAVAFCNWLLHATRLTRPELRILYDVYGRPPEDEMELRALAGYRDSRPVRIRNAAAGQLQLDCYGEVVDATTQLHGDDIDRETQALLVDLGSYVMRSWHLPDHGIWETRGELRHRTHSRVLCWVALDRLARLQQRGVLRGLDTGELLRTCDAIRNDVEQHAWNDALGAYVDTYGSDELDACVLLHPYYGFASATSPRMRSTFRQLEQRLRPRPGLYYRNEQSLVIGEGAFGICTGWAIDYLVRAGRWRDARAELDAFACYANDVGLFAEEIDPRTGEALGNFPQAFTHIGLLTAALAVAEPDLAERRSGGAA